LFLTERKEIGGKGREGEGRGGRRRRNGRKGKGMEGKKGRGKVASWLSGDWRPCEWLCPSSTALNSILSVFSLHVQVGLNHCSIINVYKRFFYFL